MSRGKPPRGLQRAGTNFVDAAVVRELTDAADEEQRARWHNHSGPLASAWLAVLPTEHDHSLSDAHFCGAGNPVRLSGPAFGRTIYGRRSRCLWRQYGAAGPLKVSSGLCFRLKTSQPAHACAGAPSRKAERGQTQSALGTGVRAALRLAICLYAFLYTIRPCKCRWHQNGTPRQPKGNHRGLPVVADS